MPAQSTATSSAPRKQTPKPVRAYLFVYNLVSLALWATCTLRGLLLLIKLTPPADNLPAIFHAIYSPLLAATQTLAGLEVLHSLVGFVRAPVTTTFMQVASRFLVVWGVMYRCLWSLERASWAETRPRVQSWVTMRFWAACLRGESPSVFGMASLRYSWADSLCKSGGCGCGKFTPCMRLNLRFMVGL